MSKSSVKSNAQRAALAVIAHHHPAPFVSFNRWTAAASLVRHGLVAKVLTVAECTQEDERLLQKDRRYAHLPRASYTLTEAGLAATGKVPS